MASRSFLCLFALVLFSHATADSSSDLSPCYYDEVCPEALPTITRVVNNTVEKEKRMGASLLRLHFHDCFVNGCDASILLDNTTTIFSEKLAIPNRNSVRGFDVIDRIKYEVDKVCQGPVVSCADILAVAARDSVVKLGGPTWTVELGRRDSTNASKIDADKDIPNPSMDLLALIDSFRKQGLDTKDLVALSGAHTIGFSQCAIFRKRIYNDSNIDPIFARDRQSTCPPNGNDTNLAPLDPTAAIFDTRYFANLVKKRGLLHSDQALFSGAGGATDSLVKTYSTSFGAFSDDFVESMVKMGNIKPLTGKQGQIRVNCSKVN